ncbi:YheC/YheD family protein [Evansella cellulosilytica]|uniref:ATP-grasp domain-containing protein n=1 Tax=Evansella cellulosilytica (strain ATCC 21833 / DSM 2522 / FERM P-1141 / JCM 9156 / N-4) TaxID=649639 RepID=E6TUF6_EVAC2|nr:YheC/YheD family protein [Evansella cellulosilytica]ADU29712.1 hypothetical protein Bcell_1449 [Evansella cellulosilytica DSM 2522]
MLSIPFYISNIEEKQDLHPNNCVIPAKIASIWKIDDTVEHHATLTNHFISKNIEIVVDPYLDDHMIQLPPQVIHHLRLNKNCNIQCLYDRNTNTFHLGPSIGVVVGDVYDEEHPFGPLTPYLTEMGKTATQLYYFFIVFSYKDVQGSFINGFCYQDGKWNKCITPLPHVIYNRIGRRDQEWSQSGKTFFKRLNEMNIPHFNDRFIHKWDTFSYLFEEPILRPYLPETKHLTSKDVLYDLLEKYKSSYLKPFWGKEGSGIIKVLKNEGTYFLTYPHDQGWLTKKVTADEELFTILKERVNKRPYLIQQTIDINKLDDAPIDFRILCIKDINGYWQACSAVGRIGKKDTIVSNLSQGGVQKKIVSILSNWMNEDDALQTERFLHELAVEAAYAIDNRAGGVFGELGFDFIIDKNNQVWVLEVNIKPSKGDSLQIDNHVLPSVKYLLIYAASIVGFAII